ncbi:MAG TPA: hypothetical protein VNW06_10255, partial [Cytophagaceae bacterium]|nr:hypothetical protein [Cytophagaceae bacterium]
ENFELSYIRKFALFFFFNFNSRIFERFVYNINRILFGGSSFNRNIFFLTRYKDADKEGEE